MDYDTFKKMVRCMRGRGGHRRHVYQVTVAHLRPLSAPSSTTKQGACRAGEAHHHQTAFAQ